MTGTFRLIRTAVLACAAVVTVALGFFAWQSFYPVHASGDWRYEVAWRSVPKAASLAPLDDGSLMVSLELKDGKGSIVRIHPDGSRQEVVGGLSKPDGMTAANGGWVFSQETGGAPVSLLKDGKVTDLFQGESVQGLWNDGEDLYAIEDRKDNGRLLRYRWSDGSLSVLRDRLDEAESITRCNDGRLLYTQKKQGVVREFKDDGSDPVLLGGLNQPTFLMCDPRGLWISEDSTHRARLLLVDPQGRQHTVLSFLKAPQSIVATARGTYLVAEGGRNRVLELLPPETSARN